MILLEIETNWYWFLVFGGGILALCLVVVLLERKNDDPDELLRLNPCKIIGNILFIQIAFYCLYLLVTYSIDVASVEQFWVHQVFTSVEFDFLSRRGLLTGLALILSFIFITVPIVSIIPSYKQASDYAFTTLVIHFIIVSIVQNDFPTSGAWWTAIGAGFLLAWILSERLSYQLALMSYQSSLGGSQKPKSKSVSEGKDSIELPKMQKDESTSAAMTSKEIMVSVDNTTTEKEETSSSQPTTQPQTLKESFIDQPKEEEDTISVIPTKSNGNGKKDKKEKKHKKQEPENEINTKEKSQTNYTFHENDTPVANQQKEDPQQDVV